MSLVIYLGLNAFTPQPNLLLSSGQPTYSMQTLPEAGQQGTVLLEELTETASLQIGQWLAANTAREVQLLWPQPAPYIAAFLTQDSDPDELLKRWKDQAQRLVTLFRKHRKQLGLYGYTPGQQSNYAGARLSHFPTLNVPPLQRIAAACLLNQNTELQQVHAYLIASSQEASTWQQNILTDITDALVRQRSLEDAEFENEQYAKQLDDAQQTLEQQFHELQAGKQSLIEANEKITKLSNKEAEAEALVEQAEQQLKVVESQYRQTGKSLNEAQQALEKASKDKELKESRIQQAEEENELVIKELHRLQETFEQELLEKDKRMARLQQVQKTLDKELLEKDKRMAQLHRTQEELEQSHLNKQALVKQTEAQQQNINVLRSESDSRIHQLQSLVQWLRAYAYRHTAAAYRYSRVHKKALQRQINTIEESAYFDPQWYCEQYPDIAQSGLNPAEHFIKFGALEGRNPSAQFNTEYYLTQYQDVAVSGQHPLLHYIRNGMAEERETQQPQRQLPAPEQPRHEKENAI